MIRQLLTRLIPDTSEAQKDLAAAEAKLKRTRRLMHRYDAGTPRGDQLAYDEFLLLGQVREARQAVEQEKAGR